MTYAVVGATVNLASRMEGLTRKLDSKIAMSDPLRVALPVEAVDGLVTRRAVETVRNMQDQVVWTVSR